MIYLDTHVVVWLYRGQPKVFPPKVRKLLDTDQLFISPAVFLEMEFLFEVGKIRDHADPIFEYLNRKVALSFCTVQFEDVARKAAHLRWTRDPFDRLIVGHAIFNDSVLLTKDKTILSNYPKALWK